MLTSRSLVIGTAAVLSVIAAAHASVLGGSPTEGDDLLQFQGVVGRVDTTLTNPYTGRTLDIVGEYNVNSVLYDGLAGYDRLFMSQVDDFLPAEDENGHQSVTSVEYAIGGSGSDVLVFAHPFFTHGNLTLVGGADSDVIWSSVGDDLLAGGTGDDDLDGGPGADLIFGEDGNERLRGGAGDDEINGGNHFDTAYYSGAFADYTVLVTAGGLTVEDNVGTDGFDTVATVERLVFADGIYEGGVFMPFAREIVRVGTPPNPSVFLPGLTSGPALGEVWDPVVDHTTFAPLATLDALLVTFGPTNLDVGGKGTLLCDPPFIDLMLTNPNPGTPFILPIPDDPILLGFDLCFQAAAFPAGASFKLTNALDVTFGLAPLE